MAQAGFVRGDAVMKVIEIDRWKEVSKAQRVFLVQVGLSALVW